MSTILEVSFPNAVFVEFRRYAISSGVSVFWVSARSLVLEMRSRDLKKFDIHPTITYIYSPTILENYI